jgi:uncharacterized protein involved in type VI secretion and phage assembly
MKKAAARRAPLRFGKYRGTVVDNQDPAKQGRLRVRVPDVLGKTVSASAMPCAPYVSASAGFHAVPSTGTDVFVEFEAGDLSRPIWTGGLWQGGELPPDERGTPATPDVKLLRSEQGLLLAMHDDRRTIAISDSMGANILTIDVQQGVVTIKATQKVVVDAPVIELSANARHPAVQGDELLTYLNWMVVTFNTHMHAGQMAGTTPVAPAPPVPPLPPPSPSMLSLRVKLD